MKWDLELHSWSGQRWGGSCSPSAQLCTMWLEVSFQSLDLQLKSEISKKDLPTSTKRPFYIIHATLWRLPPAAVGSLRARTRRNSILESSKGHSTLPPKPFSHLKINERPSRGTLYKHPVSPTTSVAALSGKVNRCALSESSAHHRAPFKHCRPSSNLPETCWLLSNFLCWCHMSTMFHSHPSKISALSKSNTKLYVLLHAKQPKFIIGKHSTMVENRTENT